MNKTPQDKVFSNRRIHSRRTVNSSLLETSPHPSTTYQGDEVPPLEETELSLLERRHLLERRAVLLDRRHSQTKRIIRQSAWTLTLTLTLAIGLKTVVSRNQSNAVQVARVYTAQEADYRWLGFHRVSPAYFARAVRERSQIVAQSI